MIIDLAEHETDAFVATDVLIIGGGIAGLLLACKLRDRGARVVVLESGGKEQKDEVHPLNRVVMIADQYRGASHGRFRCLGGTSTRWGGALIPFIPEDFSARPYLGLSSWPIAIDDVEPYLGEVETHFGIAPGSYGEDFVRDTGADKFVPVGDQNIKLRFAKWPRFKNRNVATLFKDRLRRDLDLSVWINATATSFELDEQGRIHSVIARHQSGRAVSAAAAEIVVCAGAIESTRLLLLLDWKYQVFSKCDALGRFFHDHISAQVATIKPKRVVRLNRMAGFRFSGRTMRSLRFELSPYAQAAEGVTSAFGHISFHAGGSKGFAGLREFFRTLQRSGRVEPRLVLEVLADLPYLSRAALWRYAHKQLYWPKCARHELHVVAEQCPRPENQIRLAPDLDPFGLPLAAISWRVSSQDCKTFSAYVGRFDSFWKTRELGEVGEIEWLASAGSFSLGEVSRGVDVYHPAGSTRMGVDGGSAVVDRHLRTFAIPNLWVLSTSVFPSSASANPTLTLMLFALRLANHLADRLSRAAV